MLRRTLAHLLLPRLAAGTLPGWLAAAMHKAVRGDARLARDYDALRRAERTASPTSEVSAAQADLLEALILQSIPASRAAPRRWALPGAAGALAAAAVIAFVVVQPSAHDGDQPFPIGDLSARSARLAAEPLGVKVTCLQRVAGAPAPRVTGSATGGARQPGGLLTCPRGSLMAFSTTNMGAATRHVFVVGIGKNGERRWYAPFDKVAGSTAIPAGNVDVVLPTLADTTTMPAEDQVSLFVLISDEPFAAASVERQLEASARRGVPLAQLERLPLVDVPLQARIDLMSRDLVVSPPAGAQ